MDQDMGTVARDMGTVAQKFHLQQKKRITRTFTVFAPFVLVCVLAIGKTQTMSIVVLFFYVYLLLSSLVYGRYDLY